MQLHTRPDTPLSYFLHIIVAMTRNSFLRFRAGHKVNLRQYIKSDFDLFWGPDVLWRSDFDVINRSSNFIRLLLNSPLESHWIRGLKLTSKLRAVQFWVSWKKMTTKSERRTSASSGTVCICGKLEIFSHYVLKEVIVSTPVPHPRRQIFPEKREEGFGESGCSCSQTTCFNRNQRRREGRWRNWPTFKRYERQGNSRQLHSQR